MAAISAYGAGFDLPDQDAFVIGRGMAFVATADNPSAIYYNPAGIGQLKGNNLRGGIYGIYLDPYYTPPNSGTRYDNQDKLHGIPQFYYTYGRDTWPVSLGLGIYSPDGLGLKWSQDAGFRMAGIRSSLTTVAINPVLALKLSPRFYLGGGIVINYSYADLRRGLFSSDPNADQFRFEGDGWDVGYNLGALWKPVEKFTIGVSFRSGLNTDLHGHAAAYNNNPPYPAFSQNPAAHGRLPYPLKAIFGFSYRPTPAWNFEFNADYTDWSALGTVTIYEPGSTYLPSSVPLVLDWRPSWYYEFGATRYFTNGWHVSAGYIFNENSIPDAHYTPLVADENRHFLSAGIGFKGRRFDFDVAYQFGYGPDHTVVGSNPPADGRYGFISHAVAVSSGIHF